MTEGNYRFEVLPNRQYRVTINAEGYESGSYSFFTSSQSNTPYGQALFLRKITAPIPPEVDPTPPSNPGIPSPPTSVGFGVPGETYTLRGTSRIDNLEYQSNAPRHAGVYYKIQLAAVTRFDPADSRYANLSSLGTIQTEFIISRNLTRVLLGDFMDEASARKALAQAKSKGFTIAYIAKYENGVRYGKVNL